MENDYGTSCILSYIGASESVIRNKGKLVALLVYPSFRRVTTSILRRILVIKSSGSQVIPSIRIQYSIAAQLKGRNDYDVTRQVATEHGRNKCSLLEIFSLFNSHVENSSNIKLHCVN